MAADRRETTVRAGAALYGEARALVETAMRAAAPAAAAKVAGEMLFGDRPRRSCGAEAGGV